MNRKIFVTAGREIKPFQNNKNLHEYDFSKTFLEEKNTNFIALENENKNEIQFGDLFEDFIRELEKENYESKGRIRKKRRRRRGI